MNSAKKTGMVLLSLALVAALAGTAGCQKKAAESQAAEPQKSVNEFEGAVNAALGRYLYLSTASGFDIVLPGFDAATLVGKTIKVKGKLLAEYPSVFLADSVEAKDSPSPLYTRSQEFQVEDYVDLKTRESVPGINIAGVNNPEEWEGKGRIKVYGTLQKGDVTTIVISDDKGKEIAKIIVDSLTTYTDYYLKKLRLFNKFWFYLNVKDTVDRKIRTRSKEIFHAEIFDVGLY